MIFVVSQSFIWFPWMMGSSFSAGNTETCTLKTGFMTHTRFLEGRHAGLTCGGSWVEDQGEGDKGSRRRVRVKSAPANTDDLGGVWHTWHIRHTAGDHCMHRCFHEIATVLVVSLLHKKLQQHCVVTISAVSTITEQSEGCETITTGRNLSVFLTFLTVHQPNMSMTCKSMNYQI